MGWWWSATPSSPTKAAGEALHRSDLPPWAFTPRTKCPGVCSVKTLRSSKALTGFLAAHERHHALIQLATPSFRMGEAFEQCLPGRHAVEHCVANHNKLERHPRAGRLEPLHDLGHARDHLVLMELCPGIEPVAALTDGEQRLVPAALVDGLTPDVQELAGLLSRKHAPRLPHQLFPALDFAGKIECLGIELRHCPSDNADIREDPGQSAEIGRSRHRLDERGLVGPFGESLDDMSRAPDERVPNRGVPFDARHDPRRGPSLGHSWFAG